MGLFDGWIGSLLRNLIGSLGHGQQDSSNPLLSLAQQLIQQSGGLRGLLDALSQGGLAKEADSWVGTGPNLGVTGEMLQKVLDSGLLDKLGAQHGMSANEVSSGLAEVLPELINQMTPNGRVEENSDDLIAQALEALRKR